MNWLEVLATLINQQQLEQAKRLQCGVCKASLQNVIDVGKMGCPACYDMFAPILVRFVEQMQSKHVGKHPKGEIVRGLEEEAVVAALEGRFEDAESIKDRIKGLRGS